MQHINKTKEIIPIEGYEQLTESLKEKPQGECSDFYCAKCGTTRRIFVDESDPAGRDTSRAAFVVEHEDC